MVSRILFLASTISKIIGVPAVSILSMIIIAIFFETFFNTLAWVFSACPTYGSNECNRINLCLQEHFLEHINVAS